MAILMSCSVLKSVAVPGWVLRLHVRGLPRRANSSIQSCSIERASQVVQLAMTPIVFSMFLIAGDGGSSFLPSPLVCRFRRRPQP